MLLNLIDAIKQGDLHHVNAWLYSGADINQPIFIHGNTALHLACYYSAPEVVKLLLDAGANMYVKAADMHASLPVRYLFDGYQASWNQDVEVIIKMFYEKGFDINSPIDIYGLTMQHSASFNAPYILQSLITLGADINIKSKDAVTPLHIAAQHNAECVYILKAQGADLESLDSAGHTPLERAKLYAIPTHEQTKAIEELHSYYLDQYTD